MPPEDLANYPGRASSLRFDPSSMKPTTKVGSCSSSRFSFTISHHFDTLKPWNLTLIDAPPISLGPGLVSPLNARPLSFASPAARGGSYAVNPRKGQFPSTPLSQQVTARSSDDASARRPRTPGPCFLESPAALFGARRGYHVNSRLERWRESFAPLVKFYWRQYDKMVYRSKMRPPLGGLISIIPPHAAATCVGIPTVLDKTKSDMGKSVHRTEYLT